MKDYHSAISKEYQGLYSRRFEHDSCGVGFTAQVGGQADHSLVEQALTALVNLEHRGAIGGDKSTGDGSGIMLHLPDDFLRSECSSSGIELPSLGHYGVGMVFLPVDPESADRCRRIIEHKSEEEGTQFLGWRKVPVESRVLGTHARSSEPRIEQCFIGQGSIRPEHLERKLYVIRRLVEKEVETLSPIPDSFYVVTLSCCKIVYKGLMTASQISGYFPDLADPRLISPVAVVHQRYSTNTLPTWKLAQPFRFIAHNGEINTLSGNINRMKTRESILKSELFGEDLDKIKPIIQENGSDSAIFDNVLELLVLGGRSLPHAMMMMIPEPYGPRIQMSEDKRAFYEFHSAVMEPWDGPAAMVFCDHNYTGGILDRNGLRPARTTTTHSGLIVLSSETGVLNLPPDQILRQGRLRPGQMFLIDHHQDRIIPDREIKARISRQKPYRRWVKDNQIQLRGLFAPASIPHENSEWLYRRQRIFHFTEEEIKMVLIPMATYGQEAINSMGNDAPLAVLSTQFPPLYNYFKQQFAQVTNPPIDPLREDLVMSLESFVGGEGSLLDEAPEQFYGFKLNHPILSPEDLNRIKQAGHRRLQVEEINILFDPDHQGESMEETLNRIFQQVEQAIRQGTRLIILTDRNTGPEMAPIPALLAVAGLHHHLIRQGLRNQAGIIIESGSVKEVFHYALLIGYGADAICPYLTFATLRHLAENGRLEAGLTAEKAMDHYITAVKKGILKTMSRMGISTLHSFYGSQLFEAIGLSQSLIDRYFRGTVTRIGGLGIRDVAREASEFHLKAVSSNPEHDRFLELGGQYRYRRNSEKHFWTPESIAKLQSAVRSDSYAQFQEFTRMVDQQIHRYTTLRGMFQLIPDHPVPPEEVEPAESIVKRLVTSAMSMGSISPEAHQTIALAQNRLGSRSNSGEGGEDPRRSKPDESGVERRSKTRQIASGRFGVTPEYLISADELQIKMAQGAKPGEGGQLPGHKVSDEIARVRHTTPGVTLISPPPHHDIYSIEDLAQLIHDLHCINPQAEISVKLVSTAGVGTIASGVAKAKADRVLISGYDGGTGASPITSIQHAGIPWELGLAEAHQSLILNRLRDKIIIQVDGQLKTGRDIVIAALLGAEEFGFGTMTLIALGCVMMRKCHLNHCAAGIATQDPQLRRHFQGKPEYIERLMMFLA
ncbi:MAG: glutamate synthase large subunit, partial [Candidatus Delongbacteria bacterium]|nr:glutamate synthase large subunit [Candidatus Delongbacteria bacterium]